MIHQFKHIFSYWIFIWSILYIFGFTMYNPLFALYMGLIINIIMYLLFLFYKNYYNSLLFLILNTIIKLIPILIILKYKNKTTIHLKDIYFTIFLFLIFFIANINNKNKYSFFNRIKTLRYFKDKKITTIGMYITHLIIKKIKNSLM